MKKIMVTMVAAMLGMAAYSASVSWSTTSAKDADGNSLGSSSLYTATVLFWADNAGSKGDAISTTGTSDTTAAMSKYAGTTGDSFANNTTYWTQLILEKNDGSKIIKSDIASFTTDSAASYNLNFTSGSGFTSATAKIDYASGWTAAPEPTSGLLLLLGVAGLALKRKCA